MAHAAEAYSGFHSIIVQRRFLTLATVSLVSVTTRALLVSKAEYVFFPGEVLGGERRCKNWVSQYLPRETRFQITSRIFLELHFLTADKRYAIVIKISTNLVVPISSHHHHHLVFVEIIPPVPLTDSSKSFYT